MLCFVALLDYHVHTVAMIVMHVQVNISTYVDTCTPTYIHLPTIKLHVHVRIIYVHTCTCNCMDMHLKTFY